MQRRINYCNKEWYRHAEKMNENDITHSHPPEKHFHQHHHTMNRANRLVFFVSWDSWHYTVQCAFFPQWSHDRPTSTADKNAGARRHPTHGMLEAVMVAQMQMRTKGGPILQSMSLSWSWFLRVPSVPSYRIVIDAMELKSMKSPGAYYTIYMVLIRFEVVYWYVWGFC